MQQNPITPKHRFTDDEVLEIRSRYVAGTASGSALAREFGVSRQAIHNIIHGKSYSDVSGADATPDISHIRNIRRALAKESRRKRRTPDERFWDYIEEDELGCWIWRGPMHPTGYGLTSVASKRVYAHRWAYERFIGPIPYGLTIDHLCFNPQCVNPGHLEPVTAIENARRGLGKPGRIPFGNRRGKAA